MAGAPQATLPAQDGQAQAAVAPALLQLELSHAEAAVHAGVRAGFAQKMMQLLHEEVDQKRRKLEELQPKEARVAAAERRMHRLNRKFEKDAERLNKARDALGLAEGKLLVTTLELEKAEAARQAVVKGEEPSASTPELLEDEAVTETGGGPEAGACAGGEVDEMQGVQEEEQAQKKREVFRALVETQGLSEDEAKAALSAVEEFKRRRCGRSASSTGRQPSGSPEL